jgi:hypothetical protein
MFTKNSQLVKTWVRLIKAGKYKLADVPDISNLRAIVTEVLEEG